MTPKEHAKLLGLFMWLFAGLQIGVIALISIFYVVVFGVIAGNVGNTPHRANEPPPEAILGIVLVVMIFVLVITLAFMIPKIVAGYGLRKGKSWAKVWTIISCVLAVMSVPFGTAVGVYGLWFVFGDAGKAFFDGPDFAATPTTTAAPPPNSWQ
jgi:hypothetical protein